MRKMFVIFLLPVLWACNNNKDVSIVNSFKINQPLTHKVLDVQDAAKELLDPYSIAVSGNTITTWNPRSPDIFTTIDITTKRVIKHWGTKGQGPNEFLGLIDIYNNYSESGINVWDGLLYKLYFFSHSNLESASTYFQTIPIGLILKGEDRRDSRSVMQIDSSLFFTMGGNDNKRFSLIDLKNNEVKEIGDFPPKDINTQLPVWLRNVAYNGRIRYNSSLKKLVYMSFDSELFEIYNINGTNVELAMGNYTTVPKYKDGAVRNGLRNVITEDIENGKGRNRMVAVSDENIFILYQDYKRVGMVKKTDWSLTADIILVFDWDGNPVKIYELDCFVTGLEYDKARNRLWAIHNNPYPEIVYFEL